MNSSLTSQVVKRSDIVEVIQAYGISLFKAGRNYRALCPFHDDKNPSMSVSPDKQIFKCFSCQTGGNAVDFVYQYECKVNNNPNFKRIDAIKKVIEICNIDIHIENNETDKIPDYLDPNQRYMAKINKNVNKIFTYYLNQTAKGKEALEYLHQRGLSDEIINDLELGYCFENSALLNDKNFDIAKYVGLAKDSENRRYEVLRNRIVFPIKNDKGDIVGFSGRILSQEKSSIKYLNTEENLLFKKGDILYNFDDAKKHVGNDGIYIVEGYMDVIAAKMTGLHNTCALMGTALTEKHIELLKSINCPVNLMLDTDEPGRKAIIKAINQLEQNGIVVNVVDLKELGELKDLGEYHEFVIKNTSQDKTEEKLKALKSQIIKTKEKPAVFKVKRYMEELGLDNKLSIVNIEDIYRKFKNELKGSNLTAVTEYLESITEYTGSEINRILNPVNKNYSDFLNASLNKALDEILFNEVSQKEDTVLKNYYLQNKEDILEQANLFLQEDGGYLYQNGAVVGFNLLNAVLRKNKSYEQYREIYTFKYQSLFDNCYADNSSNKISLSKSGQLQFVEKYNSTFENNELKNKNNITEAYVIDKIDDLFNILPVKMMNQFQFKDIQRAFHDKKMICFDFNTIFDTMQVKMGILDYFDKSFKADNNKLKAVLIYPNQDKSIKIPAKSSVKKIETDQKDHTVEETADKSRETDTKNISDSYINVFVNLIKRETEKGFYFKVPKNESRCYFASKKVCRWYGNDKRTLRVSLRDVSEIGEYFYDKEKNKFQYTANASYSQIEKDFKVFKSDNREKQNKTSYMIFKEYDINSFEKNGTKYAVVSIPYKNETATMMIPFSYMHKKTDGKISFKVQSSWTYNIDLNGVKEKKTPDEIMKIYNQDKNYEHENYDKDIDSYNGFERSVVYG
ncbi:MAG: DNA primase [Thomasclavelia ramosa]